MLLSDKKISKTQIKSIDGISKNVERISAFLIGQIGKNAAIENNPINLQFILNEIYSVVSAAKALIGGRIIFLECEDNEKLIKHYQDHGFTLIQDDKSGLRTMYTNIIEHPINS